MGVSVFTPLSVRNKTHLSKIPKKKDVHIILCTHGQNNIDGTEIKNKTKKLGFSKSQPAHNDSIMGNGPFGKGGVWEFDLATAKSSF